MQPDKSTWESRVAEGLSECLSALPAGAAPEVALAAAAIRSAQAGFPAHKAGLMIEHNPHLGNYETVAEWVARREVDDDDWPSPEQRDKAIATDTLWLVQWYPETPVGFRMVAAADLAEALKAASE